MTAEPSPQSLIGYIFFFFKDKGEITPSIQVLYQTKCVFLRSISCCSDSPCFLCLLFVPRKQERENENILVALSRSEERQTGAGRIVGVPSENWPGSGNWPLGSRSLSQGGALSRRPFASFRIIFLKQKVCTNKYFHLYFKF